MAVPYEISPDNELVSPLTEVAQLHELPTLQLVQNDNALADVVSLYEGWHPADDESITDNAKMAAEAIATEAGALLQRPVAILQEAVQIATTEIDEKVKAPRYSVRGATADDIEALVEVDMKAFARVYDAYDMTIEELRQDLIAKFKGRYDKLGSRWISVFEKDGEIHGFLMSCPTDKSPEEFESWEKTTDQGTLEATYDPEGKNIYVVSLSMREGAGEVARNMLFAHQMSEMIRGGFERAFFESRLPGLRTWARRECRAQGLDFATLDEDQKLEMANTYFTLTKTVEGEEVPYDYLMRIYASAGCKFVKMAPNAYRDEPSMNFGAVGVFENPLPQVIRRNRIARNVASSAMRLATRSQWFMQKAF